MKKDKVLIEKFKGFDICYDKNEERFVADKPNVDLHFEARTLWEIKGRIKETQVEEIEKEYIIISGYFNKTLSKIRLLTKNKATKTCKYKILEGTEDKYDNGQIKEERDIPKLFPLSKKNLEIYNKIKDLESKINGVEEEQKDLVESLEYKPSQTSEKENEVKG